MENERTDKTRVTGTSLDTLLELLVELSTLELAPQSNGRPRRLHVSLSVDAEATGAICALLGKDPELSFHGGREPYSIASVRGRVGCMELSAQCDASPISWKAIRR